MRKQETVERTHDREKRAARRLNRIDISRKRKDQREKDLESKQQALRMAAETLKKDNMNDKSCNKKRPGQESFIPVFAFIPWSPYDKRDKIPSNYSSRSFNERKQYLDFFRDFIYPYKVPQFLFWAAFEQETIKDSHGRDMPSPDVEIIRLAKKWICDIVSGESFAKQNSDHFTKAEAHIFLTTDIVYKDPSSVIELLFYTQCMARKICVKRSWFIAKIFTIKFIKQWDHPMVNEFIDLIARSTDYNIENAGLGDICDFVLEKIKMYRESHEKNNTFSFSGRTMASVIALANEWHADILRKIDAQNALIQAEHMINGQRGSPRRLNLDRWNGIYIYTSLIKEDNCIWSFAQLCSARELLNEGRIMKNCVSSYTAQCASGQSTIFHVSRYLNKEQVNESVATLEVSKNRVLVQAKSKFNTGVMPSVMRIIKKWGQCNRIKVH
jgi:hypothetical protein